jgi:hypothetical protein
MSEYKIERWDVVMFNNSLTKVPMIYVKPDMTFLEFARSNNFAVACEISGTGTVYDGKTIPGVVDKSCYVPNCRPNFCEKTGFYVITLWANWYGYPEPGKLGVVKFSGTKAAPDNSYKHSGPAYVPSEAPQKVRETKNPRGNKGMNTTEILIVTGVIVASLVAILVIAKLLKKK